MDEDKVEVEVEVTEGKKASRSAGETVGKAISTAGESVGKAINSFVDTLEAALRKLRQRIEAAWKHRLSKRAAARPLPRLSAAQSRA